MNNILAALVSLQTRFFVKDDERGATATEYAILVSFIALAVIAGATLFGSALSTWFSGLAAQVTK